MVEGLKMTIAYLIDRLFPKACWADLALWAIGDLSFAEVDFSGRCCEGGDNFDEVLGGCYCGKHRARGWNKGEWEESKSETRCDSGSPEVSPRGQAG